MIVKRGSNGDLEMYTFATLSSGPGVPHKEKRSLSLLNFLKRSIRDINFFLCRRVPEIPRFSLQ